MVSFCDLYNKMQNEQDVNPPLMDSGESTKSMQAIRNGLGFHEDGKRSFWDEFIDIASQNSENLAELLGTTANNVRTWSSRIKENLDKVKNHDEETGHQPEKTQVFPTGDNGAITTKNSNEDPPLGGTL